MKQLLITILFLSFATIPIASLTLFAQSSTNLQQQIYPLVQCNDGIDNDSDGLIDFAFDPECTSWVDDREEPDPIPPSLPVSPPVIPPIPPVVPKPPQTGQDLTNISILEPLPIQEDISKLVQKYFWAPLGTIIGDSEDDGSVQGVDTKNVTLNNYIASTFSLVIVYLVGFSSLGLYLVYSIYVRKK